MPRAGNMAKTDIPGWVPLIASVAVLVGGSVWVLHNEFTKVNEHLSRIDRRADAFDDVLRILSKSQSGDIQGLINEILSQAKSLASAGKAESANKFLAVAAKMTQTLADSRNPASPQFFQAATLNLEAVRNHDNPALKTGAFKAQVHLAEYRSALQSAAENIPGQAMVQCHFRGPATTFWDRTNGKGAPPLIDHITFIDCDQPLDNVVWNNVVFVNGHITYNGGPVVLSNVMFVNCTFEVKQNDHGAELLRYATLDDKLLQIQPNLLPGLPIGLLLDLFPTRKRAS